MVLITTSYTMLWISIHSSPGTQSDLIPWIYLSLSLYNHKEFDLGHTLIVQWFSLLSSTKVWIFNKEFMIWATGSSQSCFCWLYRASLSLAAKNIITLLSVVTIWWNLLTNAMAYTWSALVHVPRVLENNVHSHCWVQNSASPWWSSLYFADFLFSSTSSTWERCWNLPPWWQSHIWKFHHFYIYLLFI